MYWIEFFYDDFGEIFFEVVVIVVGVFVFDCCDLLVGEGCVDCEEVGDVWFVFLVEVY